MTAQSANVELGNTIDANGIMTNYHDVGQGEPLVMIHGSGPGVSAWANWRTVLPKLSADRRVIAPDMAGFGYTERPEGIAYNLETWLAQMTGLLDALELDQVDLVGNSFGGGLSVAFAIRFPERVRRMILMGSAGVSFEMTDGLEAVWGYEPSASNMRKVMDFFAYDRTLVTDELAELRYKASIQPGFQESFASMFPAPRQRWVESLASNEDDIRALQHETLILHGRDDRVVPLETSLKLNQFIEPSQLHIFGKCGHWVQIEQNERFVRMVSDFLDEEKAD